MVWNQGKSVRAISVKNVIIYTVIIALVIYGWLYSAHYAINNGYHLIESWALLSAGDDAVKQTRWKTPVIC